MNKMYVPAFAAALAFVASVYAQTTQPTGSRASVTRLRQIGMAVNIYVTENRGHFPERLAQAFAADGGKMLLPVGEVVPDDFDSWDATNRAQFIESRTDVTYAMPAVRRITKLKNPVRTPVLFTRDPDEDKALLIGFADGHVERFVPAWE